MEFVRKNIRFDFLGGTSMPKCIQIIDSKKRRRKREREREREREFKSKISDIDFFSLFTLRSCVWVAFLWVRTIEFEKYKYVKAKLVIRT